MGKRNATHLFEGDYEERIWPPSSRILLDGRIRAVSPLPRATWETGHRTDHWQCTQPERAPWYTRSVLGKICFRELDFESIAVEPRALS